MRVVGIDPSTTDTGVAILDIDGECVMIRRLLSLKTPRVKGMDTVTDRAYRLRWTRKVLEMEVESFGCDGIDLVAYEQPHTTNYNAVIALNAAIGAVTSASCFSRSVFVPVNSNAVKAALGQSNFFGRSFKRAEGKVAVIRMVNARFHLDLTDNDDAKADAIGVALAGYRKHVNEKAKAEKDGTARQSSPRLRAKGNVGRKPVP